MAVQTSMVVPFCILGTLLETNLAQKPILPVILRPALWECILRNHCSGGFARLRFDEPIPANGQVWAEAGYFQVTETGKYEGTR